MALHTVTLSLVSKPFLMGGAYIAGLEIMSARRGLY